MLDDIAKDNLQSILESIALIEDRFSKVSRADDFVLTSHGVLILDSITMRLQVIGELLKTIHKIDSSLFEKHSEVPWNKIIKLRDIISHHYDVIDHEIIYDICKNHIPELAATVRSMLQTESKG